MAIFLGYAFAASICLLLGYFNPRVQDWMHERHVRKYGCKGHR